MTFPVSQKRQIIVLAALLLVYVLARTAWYERYPPSPTSDNYSYQIVTNIQRDNTLYVADPVWRGHVDNELVFQRGIYIYFMLILSDIFGGFVDAWTPIYLLHLLIFLPGAYLVFRTLMGQIGLSALMAVASSIPVYYLFSWEHWGISSPYPYTFVIVQAVWLLLALFQQPGARDMRRWVILGAVTGSLIYWNPVHGFILAVLIGFGLLADILMHRSSWRGLVAYGLGLVPLYIPFLYGYWSQLTIYEASGAESMSDANLQRVVDAWVSFAGFHFYPWIMESGEALRAVIVCVLGAALLLLSLPLLSARSTRWWWIIGGGVAFSQVFLPKGFGNDPGFWIVPAYWLYRRDDLDRLDVLMLSMLVAANLIGPAAGAAGRYLFVVQKIQGVWALAFELPRSVQWAYLVLYFFAARWVAHLVNPDEEGKINFFGALAAACILGSVLSKLGRFGTHDMVVVRPDENLRWTLTWAGIALALLAQIPRRRPIFKVAASALAVWIGITILNDAWMVYPPINPPSERLIPIGTVILGMAVWASAIFPEAFLRAEWVAPAIDTVLKGAASLAVAWIAMRVVVTIPAFKDASAEGIIAGTVLLVTVLMWTAEAHFSLPAVIGSVMMALLVVAPLATFHAKHDTVTPSPGLLEAAAWARHESPKDAVFLLVNGDPDVFRAESWRAVYAPNYIAAYSLIGAEGMLEQYEIDEQLAALDLADSAAFQRSVNMLEVDFIVIEDGEAGLPYPPALEAGSVTVYEVPHQR